MRLIDTHFHIWDRARAKQRDILAAPYLQRDVTWSDYLAARSGILVESAVNVHVNDLVDPIPEVEFVSSVAAEVQGLGAMVAWGPLESAKIVDCLEQLAAFPLVVGVRRGTQHESDPLFCATPEFIAGAKEAAARGILCELCVKEHQLEGVIELAKQAPETIFVVDHLGKPQFERGDWDVWASAIAKLAECPNVMMKVSVVVNSDKDPPLTKRKIERYVIHALDRFGSKRVMFGSNWPVSTTVIAYAAWVEDVADILSDLDTTETSALFADNARTVYKLDPRREALGRSASRVVS